MAIEKPHALLIYFGTKTAKENKAYKIPLKYYEPYFKELHEFEGSKLRISFDYRLKDYDQKKHIYISCPYCNKVLQLKTDKLIKDKGAIKCSCNTGKFVITPKGQLIFIETWSVKSASVISNGDDIKEWLQSAERYYDIWVDVTDKNWDGLTVYCSDNDIDNFKAELEQTLFDFEIVDEERWDDREKRKRLKKSGEEEEVEEQDDNKDYEQDANTD